jgi:hypothetical protein
VKGFDQNKRIILENEDKNEDKNQKLNNTRDN